MGAERRRFFRLASRLTTIFKILKSGKVRRALTKDMGGGGLCLITEEMLEPGTKLAVEIKLPDRAETVTFLAEVVWSRLVCASHKSYENVTVETGVRFIDPNPKDQALIIQYARMNAPPAL